MKKIFLTLSLCFSVLYFTSCSEDEPVGDMKNHEYVDLGLPSGTLWATCNVGAENPEDYGEYFAWGETSPKSEYSSSNYPYLEEHWRDINFTLELKHDAAYMIWGKEWKMPTSKQFAELINDLNTTSVWTTRNGVNGRLITSKSNGNSIFLPAAGYRYKSDLEQTGEEGYYWTSSKGSGSDSAINVYVYSRTSYTYYCSCCCGLSIRPVRR